MATKKQIAKEQFINEFQTAVATGDKAALMALINPDKYVGTAIHRSRYLNHWKRVAAQLTGLSNDTKGGSKEFQRLFSALCSAFLNFKFATRDRLKVMGEMRLRLQESLDDNRTLKIIIERQKNQLADTRLELANAQTYVQSVRDIGDAIVQTGFAETSEEVGPVGAAAINLLWKYSTCLEQLGDMRTRYESACKTIAAMHAAALGKVVGPVEGVIEDVAKVRVDLARERRALSAVMGTCGVAGVEEVPGGHKVTLQPGRTFANTFKGVIN